MSIFFSLGILTQWPFILLFCFLSQLPCLIFSHELPLHLSLVNQRILYNQQFIPVKGADLPHTGEEQLEGECSFLLLSDNYLDSCSLI